MSTTTPKGETIGFIGLGLMGHGMAKNIVEKGYPLTVLGHRNRKPIEDLVGRGAVEAESAKHLAARCSIVRTGVAALTKLTRRSTRRSISLLVFIGAT